MLHQLLEKPRSALSDGLERLKFAVNDQLLPPLPVEPGLDIAQLEDRVMLSATPMAPVDMNADADAATAEALVQMASGSEDIFVNETDNNSLTAASGDEEASDRGFLASSEHVFQVRKELVVVDTSAENYQQLVDDFLNNADESRTFEIQFLDRGRDGVQQISELLANYADLDAIHLVSHGSQGKLALGNTWLGADNLAGYAGDIATWNNALGNGADLLIYGCDLAESEARRSLTESLGALCDCDVAASVDDTGHARYGGDWDLEFATGTIETAVAFSADAQQNWLSKLSVINVDTFDDVIDGGDGLTSLREAILQVNGGTGGDTIILQAGTYTLSLGPVGDDIGNSGDLDILKDVTITGAGAQSTIIDGNGFDRVFHIQNDTTTVSMSRLTIQGGSADHNGGGIFIDNLSVLNISDAVLTDNDGNNAAGVGAGGAIHVHGTLNADRVLFSANTAKDGGAIYFHDGAGPPPSGSLTNVTISGNSATSNGGGIWTDTTITVTNSTITLNDGINGGGIFNAGTPVNISNTIVSDNTANSANDDVLGDFSSNGFNLIEVVGSATGFGGDLLTGVSADLDVLADNGGPTQTHADPRAARRQPGDQFWSKPGCSGNRSNRRDTRCPSGYRRV